MVDFKCCMKFDDIGEMIYFFSGVFLIIIGTKALITRRLYKYIPPKGDTGLGQKFWNNRYNVLYKGKGNAIFYGIIFIIAGIEFLRRALR